MSLTRDGSEAVTVTGAAVPRRVETAHREGGPVGRLY